MNDYRFLVRLYGVRGSYPVVSGTKYGGNTTCMMTRTPSHILIFDAGSGLIQAGGKVTDFWNESNHLSNSFILASNNKIHEILLKIISNHFPDKMNFSNSIN